MDTRKPPTSHFDDARSPSKAIGPESGDVIIVVEHGNPSTKYVVQQWLGAPQITSTAQAEAFGFADRFARHQAVNVWYCEDNGYTLLAAHRPQEPGA